MLKLLDAGIDQFGGESNPDMLIKLVAEGKVSEALLDDSVRRLMLDKFRLGLFDNPYVDEKNVEKVVGNSAFVSAGKEAQRRSMVLLKNASMKGSPKTVLPITGRKRIYVENVSPELAAQYGEIVGSPEEADLAIIRIVAPYYPHEGFLDSRFHSGDLDYKGEEKRRLQTIMETVPTIVDIYLDRAAVIPDIAESSTALTANFGVTDELLLELLWGKYAPTGKLPFELPSSMQAVTAQLEDLPYDSENPLFPFGFGLTFSTN
jgi:beta-glucosidase